MKLFADENVAFGIVDWLRGRGHDVCSAIDISPATSDIDWLARAEVEGRLIPTADKDFGDLIFRDDLSSHGIILMMLGDMRLDDRISRLAEAWSIVETDPSGKFIVISSERVRVRNLSNGQG